MHLDGGFEFGELFVRAQASVVIRSGLELIAIRLDLVGEGIVVIEVAYGLLVELAGKSPCLNPAQGLGRLAQGLEEGIEGVQRDREALLGDLVLFRPQGQDNLLADDDGVVFAGHGQADPLPFGDRAKGQRHLHVQVVGTLLGSEGSGHRESHGVKPQCQSGYHATRYQCLTL
jgi:hypothetical protein